MGGWLLIIAVAVVMCGLVGYQLKLDKSFNQKIEVFEKAPTTRTIGPAKKIKVKKKKKKYTGPSEVASTQGQ